MLKTTDYTIFFDQDLKALSEFLAQNTYSQVLVLVDRNTAEFCLPLLQERIPSLEDFNVIEIDPGEENKNIDYCIGVWKMMLDFGADRQSLLINLGGGVVTDLGGFAASTFKRGMDFIHIPTTLLAQVDASVGGKTGIDLDEVKNIVGTFAQPKAVFISQDFLHTLDARQQISGFAEMLKHGLISDRAFFEDLLQTEASAVSSEQIRHSVALKSEVVTEDPLEKGRRKILNFGHTIGHAIESQSLKEDRQPLLHGEAIAIGMICEAYLSHRLNGLPQEELQLISDSLLRIFPEYDLSRTDRRALLQLMYNDKKNDHQQIGFSLLKQIGDCEFGFFAEEQVILDSLDYYQELVGA